MDRDIAQKWRPAQGECAGTPALARIQAQPKGRSPTTSVRTPAARSTVPPHTNYSIKTISRIVTSTAMTRLMVPYIPTSSQIDLAGPRSRGLAVGLNEFAGYLMAGITAWATGYLASVYGLRPEPFYLGVGYALLGLGVSAFLVGDTREHVRSGGGGTPAGAEAPHLPGGLLADHLWGSQPLRVLAGGARQQPQRRHELGRPPCSSRTSVWGSIA